MLIYGRNNPLVNPVLMINSGKGVWVIEGTAGKVMPQKGVMRPLCERRKNNNEGRSGECQS